MSDSYQALIDAGTEALDNSEADILFRSRKELSAEVLDAVLARRLPVPCTQCGGDGIDGSHEAALYYADRGEISTCEHCGGSGAEPCPTCGGAGGEMREGTDGQMWPYGECPTCEGTGLARGPGAIVSLLVEHRADEMIEALIQAGVLEPVTGTPEAPDVHPCDYCGEYDMPYAAYRVSLPVPGTTP